jgi:beta-N-acetylhexosaminidase
MASDSSVAPLIAIDQEGGLVDKVSQFYGASPSAEQLALSGTDNQAYNQAKIDASELKQLGVNVDLAPVVDVGSDVSPFYSRRFSSDPNTVTTYAGAFVKGLQENGIPAALKHFPGLGSVNEDPHYELPVVSRNLNDLQNIDFLPYKNIIQQDNPAMIMTTDVVTQALDANNAAELSPKVIDYLRHTLNFNGVIITDGMYMAGLYGHDPLPDELIAKSVQAINAGNDIIEGPSTPDEVSGIINGIKTEIQNGTLSQSQIDQSVLRILTMKIKYGIIK